MNKIIILCLPFLLLTCKQSTSNETIEGKFAIYTLKDSSLTAYDAMKVSIENLILSDSPFVTTNDLTHYYWKTHTLEFTSEMESKFDHFRKSDGSTQGVPFVVTIANEKIYFGTFWWPYSSAVPPACALIEVTTQGPYEILLMNDATDKRNDLRI
jgi:hypothetical protein